MVILKWTKQNITKFCTEILFCKSNSNLRHPVHLVLAYVMNNFVAQLEKVNWLFNKRGALYNKQTSTFILNTLLCSAIIPVAIAKEHPTMITVGSEVCSSIGNTNAITLSFDPSRSSGAAPLVVFFDATSTIATLTTRPFHELEYRWDFGDKTGTVPNLSPPLVGTSTWNTGSRAGVSSRNKSLGPMSAHVYETPGIYRVSLEVTDGTNTVANQCTQIEVLDPNEVFSGRKTICIGATSLPVQGVGGCPAGALTVQQPNFSTAISSYALTGKRVLFKRGDTFTATGHPSGANEVGGQVLVTGPGIIGAYGTGPKPIITGTFNGTSLSMSSATTAGISDWRVMDLDFYGNGGYATRAVNFDGGIDQVTLLRLTSRNQQTAFGNYDDTLEYYNNSANSSWHGHTLWDQMAVVDCTDTDPALYATSGTFSTGTFMGGRRMFFSGNSIDLNGQNEGTTVHHVSRFWYLYKSIVSNNLLQHSGSMQSTIKLHAPTWSAGAPLSSTIYNTNTGITKLNIISDNKLVAAYSPWMTALGPQGPGYDERVSDIVVERNMYIGNTYTSVPQVTRASNITFRNNIVTSIGNADNTTLVMIDLEAGQPVPSSNIWIFNNTLYKSGTGSNDAQGFNFAFIQNAAVSNVTIRNNLGYAPSMTNSAVYADTSGISGLVADHNSTGVQINNSSPQFNTTSPDWKLLAGSYAINGGATVPVWSDFYGNRRPQNSAIDIGAVEAP